jgi:mono/diheme cytochrome c family protein
MKIPILRGSAHGRPLKLIAVLLVAAATGNALLAGCGGNKTEETTTTTTPAPTTTTTTDTTTPPAAVGTAATGDAAAIFKAKCATCHGPDGHGDGPLSASLKPKPRNYHDKAYMATRTDEQLYESIYNGKSAMPAWGKTKILSEDQIRSLVKFVRGLSQQP